MIRKKITVAIDPTAPDPYFPWGMSTTRQADQAHSDAVLDALGYRDSLNYKTLTFTWAGDEPKIGDEALRRRIYLECQRQPERLR